jgi:DNA mismatch repair ATPase MutS
MKAHLLWNDRDVDLSPPALPNEADLICDLELEHLFSAMAAGDPFLDQVARSVLLHGLNDVGQIRYRQAILDDCLRHPEVIRGIYEVTTETLERKRTFWLGGARLSPSSVVSQSVRILEMFVEQLLKLRSIAEASRPQVTSPGLTVLLDTLMDQLDDHYLDEVNRHLEQLRFRHGMRISARLGDGNEGTDYVLHDMPQPTVRDRIRLRRTPLKVVIAPRDEAGFHALGEIRDRGLRLVADVLEQSTDHIFDFITALRAEAAFYVACLNLADNLRSRSEPICMPEALEGPRPVLVTEGLYDPCLSLLSGAKVAGNSIRGDGAGIIFITGANRGGKSTALRSIGIAQLMMQAGMFVAATSYRSDLRPSVFTHFKREEDASMTNGKLDEELVRMSGVVDHIRADSMLLCNESFASTNEREGSQIAADIVTALHDAGVKIVYVTHLYELAAEFYEQRTGDILFLRAPRPEEGQESFILVEGPPLPTSYGTDLYERIFGHPLLPTASSSVRRVG